MLLRTALECHKRIGEYRKDLYKLAKNKGLTDTSTIDLSKQLDKEITMLQKMMQEVRSIPY
ncbi:Spo0E like sporulation regulatory protein [Bacillus sp. OV166]|uniref:aspartyl-phosphate phosphatase Spo0E family protein n=1 Tax=Bacillus sp. OV166 TaxID=1882763 RepID=UPI000A2AA729|nr:aspartyl-phosphate phosphatase Spo0E family protein [Bacillus sp. OV166]SMQ86984.1 Spo0E like sporulation regulatory protein [Bacillus sp. OV166]